MARVPGAGPQPATDLQALLRRRLLFFALLMSGALAAADGHLYLRYADGTLVLAKADPLGYDEICSFKIPGSGERPSWSHPVILGGKLYLRDHELLFCFDIAAK